MGVYHVRLPDVGEGIAEAELVSWLVAVGDVVTQESALAEVLTDKATVEISSPVEGTVVYLKGTEGEIMAIGTEFVGIEIEGDAPESQASKQSRTAAPAETTTPESNAFEAPTDTPTSTASSDASASGTASTDGESADVESTATRSTQTAATETTTAATETTTAAPGPTASIGWCTTCFGARPRRRRSGRQATRQRTRRGPRYRRWFRARRSGAAQRSRSRHRRSHVAASRVRSNRNSGDTHHRVATPHQPETGRGVV